MFIDLAFSARLMAEREEDTISFLTRSLALFEEICRSLGGRFVKRTGDGALLTFPALSSAIDFALEARDRVARIETPIGNMAAFRTGIHVGEVFSHQNDIYGNTVNTAARLQAIAEPGGICVSREVYNLVGRGKGYSFVALGRQHIKNLPTAMDVYRVVANDTQVDPDSAVSPLTVETIGGLHFMRDGKELPVPRGKKSRGLIGCLVASASCEESVAAISHLLWPDRSPARSNSQIQKMLASMDLPIERDAVHLRLRQREVKIDLHAFDREIRNGRIPQKCCRDGAWHERILAGLETIGPSYAAWLAVIRNDWRMRVASSLEACLDRFIPGDEPLRDAAIALIAMEPTHERAARALMRHYHATENPGAARRVFEQLEDALGKIAGVKPKEETVAAAKGMRDLSEIRPASDPAALRIQLGEFTADSIKGNIDINDLKNELLPGLASFRGWSVVEVAQPSNAKRKISDYLLTGSHYRSPGEIAVSLLEPATGRTVWSDRFPYDASLIQSTKRAIVARIAATLEVYISSDRNNAAKSTQSSAAVDTWLRAERIFFRWTPQDHDEAIRLHTKVIEAEPGFAPAYASLAGAHNVRHIVRPGLARDAVASHKASELAKHAVELDPLDARNQLAMAWSASLSGDFEKAAMHMDMAARLNPNSPRTIISCAMGFAFFGNHERAGELLRHALDCAPVLADHQWCYAASVHFLVGEYGEALAAGRNGGDAIIDNAGWLTATLSKLDRHEEAAQAFDRLMSTVSDNWHSNDPADPEHVLEWFVNIYPLRRREERDLLHDAIADVIGRQAGGAKANGER